MKRKNLFVLASLLLLVASVSASALEAGKRITGEMIASMKLVTEVGISPDGKWIAYILRSPRREGEKPGGYHYRVWLADTEGKTARPLTAKQFNARSIHWFKDSKTVAFLSQREEGKKQQIYTIRIDGGEAQALTSEDKGVGRYEFSPDERLIAFSRRDGLTAKEEENKDQGKDWRVVDANFKYTRLYIHDVETGKTRLLSEQNLQVTSFEWAPDGQEIVFIASKTPLVDDTYMGKSIYRIPVSGGDARVAVATEGKLGEAVYSPNGKWMAWTGGVNIHDPSAQSLFIATRDGGQKRNLTPDYEGSVSWFEWQDDQTIAMISVEKTATHFYLVDVRTGHRERVRSSRPVFTSLSFDREKKSYAFAGSSPVHPNEVFYVAHDGEKAQRVTDSNPILNELELADQFTIEYKSQDGLLITGLVMKPVDYQAGKRYPLIVSVHGGPESAIVDGWNTYYIRWGQLLAANGYVVFWPNYRGSTGRGVSYSMADQKDLGGQEFRDIVAGIDYLADELGLVDRSRVGMGGGSYGGYFSALAATRYTRHFKAAVDFAGITNWISFTGTTEIPMENALVHWGYDRPYDHMDKLWEGSPMKYINDTRTALLIAHGGEDPRVPINQAWEMHTALKILDQTPYEFVIYPREGHGLGEREHQIDFMNRVLGWFDKHVKGASEAEMHPATDHR